MAKAFRRDEDGNVVVEFALIAPILMLVLVGVVEIGSATLVKRSVDARMTAAATYALLQPAPNDGQAALSLADSLAEMLSGGASETAQVVVNNAARSERNGSTKTVASGPGNAAMCYCPSLVQSRLTWGPAVDCAGTCAGGESAGKFLQIQVTARYISIFPQNLLFQGDMVETRAVLRMQ